MSYCNKFKRLHNFKFLPLSDKATFPTKGSKRAAGWDLYSAEDTVVPARGKAMIATDLKVCIPDDTYGRIAPRSGLTWKKSIDVGAGVIDMDFRGAIFVILFNHSDVDFKVETGVAIAQFILEQIDLSEPKRADAGDSDFAEGATERGDKCLGSSDAKK
jgi:dUTP pyrophosphatase